MKYIVLMTAVALALLCPALLAADKQAASNDTQKQVVVVDPMDLVPPVPDPELGLFQKYDGQVVVFTGAEHKSSVDKKTKKHSVELVYEIVHQVNVKGKKPVVTGKDTVVVTVNFLKGTKGAQGIKPGTVLTVEGVGSIGTDGSLTINDAVIVTDNPLGK
jgi:hypothetical protein